MISHTVKIVTPVLAVLLSACGGFGSMHQYDAADFSNDLADAAVMGKWARSCALCHINGEAGAPVVGDTAEWQRRLAQGEALVLRHVIEGYNSMPPLGYCMACEESDFRAMIGFMARTSQ